LNTLVLAAVTFVAVAAIVGGVAMLFRTKPTTKIEDRLDLLTGASSSGEKGAQAKEASILSQPLDDRPSLLQLFLERFGNIKQLFAQADTNLTIPSFTAISAVMAVAGGVLGVLLRLNAGVVPVAVFTMGVLPLYWLRFRRKRRLKAFGEQLPDALEMMARTLRSGQSLAFGFSMVSSEMPAPIAKEFGRVFEEQNLGIPLDESLRGMTERIPNLDLKFFVTALILQRQTGGDLAEILDKIGALIRDRFRIWGQIQALTGEGRLSGVVLLALPFLLLITVYRLNPDYIMLLFRDPMGTKMLVVAAVMQVFGALVIRKIVDIKV
jgi:tight adherence protein B